MFGALPFELFSIVCEYLENGEIRQLVGEVDFPASRKEKLMGINEMHSIRKKSDHPSVVTYAEYFYSGYKAQSELLDLLVKNSAPVFPNLRHLLINNNTVDQYIEIPYLGPSFESLTVKSRFRILGVIIDNRNPLRCLALGQRVMSVNTKEFKSLEYLDYDNAKMNSFLGNIEIKDLDCPNLLTLCMNASELQNFSQLAKFRKLRKLSIGGITSQNLDFSHNPELDELTLSGDCETALKLSPDSKLRVLTIHAFSLDLSKYTLETLEVYGNSRMEGKLVLPENFENLKTITVFGGFRTAVGYLSKCKNLKELTFGEHFNIMLDLSSSTQLEHLELGRGFRNIIKFPIDEPMPHLTYMYIPNRHLLYPGTVSGLKYALSRGTFPQLLKLTLGTFEGELDLSGCHSLEHLYFRESMSARVTGLENLDRLKSINFNTNVPVHPFIRLPDSLIIVTVRKNYPWKLPGVFKIGYSDNE